MNDATSRFGLPMMAAGQAQKEMAHNEALVRLDMVAQAGVLGTGVNAPPAAPEPGQCWIVGGSPEGAWAGQAGALAGWTAGGWRFVAPVEGMAVWDAGTGRLVRRVKGGWTSGAAIGKPLGGTVIDLEAREALGSILAILSVHGLIGS